MVDGKTDAEAPLVATGYQDLDLNDGLAATSECAIPRSSHLRAVSLGAL